MTGKMKSDIEKELEYWYNADMCAVEDHLDYCRETMNEVDFEIEKKQQYKDFNRHWTAKYNSYGYKLDKKKLFKLV